MTDVQLFALVAPAVSFVIALFGPGLGEFIRRRELDYWTAKLPPVPAAVAGAAAAQPTVPPDFEPVEIAAHSLTTIDASQSFFAVLLPIFGAIALHNEDAVIILTLVIAAVVAVIVVGVEFGRPSFSATWSFPKGDPPKAGIRGWWRYSFVGIATLIASLIAGLIIVAFG
jgi:hypothetical protein